MPLSASFHFFSPFHSKKKYHIITFSLIHSPLPFHFSLFFPHTIFIPLPLLLFLRYIRNLAPYKYNKTEKDFDGIFENYCVEMQNFANNGLNVPNIYAWTKLPSSKRNISGKSYDYYILQERMKGRTLFHGFIEDIYPLCKKLCSKEQFNKAVKNQEENVALFKEILTEYVADYQRMNEYLCSMPENQIDDFIYNLYVMCLDGKYSIPDIYPSNTLLSDDGFSIIDNRVENRILRGYTTQKFAERILTSGAKSFEKSKRISTILNEIFSGTCIAIFFGTSSPKTREKYDIIIVTITTAIPFISPSPKAL